MIFHANLIHFQDSVPKALLFASTGRTEEAIGQFEEILAWLREHGYNLELEGAHPRRRIRELREQCAAEQKPRVHP